MCLLIHFIISFHKSFQDVQLSLISKYIFMSKARIMIVCLWRTRYSTYAVGTYRIGHVNPASRSSRLDEMNVRERQICMRASNGMERAAQKSEERRRRWRVRVVDMRRSVGGSIFHHWLTRQRRRWPINGFISSILYLLTLLYTYICICLCSSTPFQHQTPIYKKGHFLMRIYLYIVVRGNITNISIQSSPWPGPLHQLEMG